MELLAEALVGSGQGQDRVRIRTVDAQAGQRVDSLLVAVDLQVVRLARHIRKLAQRDGVVHAVLGHMAIGGPFAAHDGQQSGVVDMDGVIARERGGLARSAVGFDQRTNADIHAEHITALAEGG